MARWQATGDRQSVAGSADLLVGRGTGVPPQTWISQHPAHSEDGEGAIAAIGAAAEYERVDVKPGLCSLPDCTPAEMSPAAPPSRTLYGAHARLGYRVSTFGIHAGVIAFQAWQANSDNDPTTNWFPELELGVGDVRQLHAVIGIGSPFVTTLRRPGLYIGGGQTWTRHGGSTSGLACSAPVRRSLGPPGAPTSPGAFASPGLSGYEPLRPPADLIRTRRARLSTMSWRWDRWSPSESAARLPDPILHARFRIGGTPPTLPAPSNKRSSLRRRR